MLLWTTLQKSPQPGVFLSLQRIEKGESNLKTIMCHIAAMCDALFFCKKVQLGKAGFKLLYITSDALGLSEPLDQLQCGPY